MNEQELKQLAANMNGLIHLAKYTVQVHHGQQSCWLYGFTEAGHVADLLPVDGPYHGDLVLDVDYTQQDMLGWLAEMLSRVDFQLVAAASPAR